MADNNRNRGNDDRRRSIGNQQNTTQTGGQNSGGRNRTASRDMDDATPRSNSDRKDRGRGSKK